MAAGQTSRSDETEPGLYASVTKEDTKCPQEETTATPHEHIAKRGVEVKKNGMSMYRGQSPAVL